MRVVYIAYLLGFGCLAIFSWMFVDPNLIYLKTFYSGIYTQRILVSSIYFLLISLLFTLFWVIKGKEKDYYKIKKMILLICIVSLFSYPAIFSFDIFNYIATAKVTFHFQENPYIMMPIEFLGDPMLLFMHAANKVALYGPLWILLSGMPFLLGFGNFVLTLLTFKLFIISFFLATLKLIYVITKKVDNVLYFGLNPLVLGELLISSHNDIVMMFFALAGIWLLCKKKILFGIFLFVLSVLIKYSTLALLPLVIYLIYLSVSKKKIDLEKIFFLSFALMLGVFIFSFLREEIYPWYAVWPLTFAGVIGSRRKTKIFLIALSYGLMLRYIPFMATGNYFGTTPVLKIILMTLPLIITGLFFLVKKYAR